MATRTAKWLFGAGITAVAAVSLITGSLLVSARANYCWAWEPACSIDWSNWASALSNFALVLLTAGLALYQAVALYRERRKTRLANLEAASIGVRQALDLLSIAFGVLRRAPTATLVDWPWLGMISKTAMLAIDQALARHIDESKLYHLALNVQTTAAGLFHRHEEGAQRNARIAAADFLHETGDFDQQVIAMRRRLNEVRRELGLPNPDVPDDVSDQG